MCLVRFLIFFYLNGLLNEYTILFSRQVNVRAVNAHRIVNHINLVPKTKILGGGGVDMMLILCKLMINSKVVRALEEKFIIACMSFSVWATRFAFHALESQTRVCKVFDFALKPDGVTWLSNSTDHWSQKLLSSYIFSTPTHFFPRK